MRTSFGAAGLIVAALSLIACESTGPDGGGGGGNTDDSSTITVAPARMNFLVYAFAPQRDPPLQTLTVTSVGGKSVAWNASTSASWISLGRTGGLGPGQLQVELNRAGMRLGDGRRSQGLRGTITISAGGTSTSVQIPVSLTISYVPPIKAIPSGHPGCGKRCSN